MTRVPRDLLLLPICCWFVAAISGSDTTAQDSRVVKDGWVRQEDEKSGITIQTRELTVHPKAEPSPALEHRLLAGEFDAVDGNAAIHFLKANGFFGESIAQSKTSKLIEDSFARAKQEGTDVDDLPPWVWLDTPPESLPLDKVKAYLRPLQFQLRHAREAARCTRFDMDRRFRELDDPMGYPLPVVQVSRELARVQRLRCRVAIAENRIDDAIKIVGQQLAMARQLGQDDFLVSALVGMGFAVTAWNDMFHLVQHPDTPNLYWALTTMPSPLVDIRRPMSRESHFLYYQCNALQEVDETPRTESHWQAFTERFLSQLGALAGDIEIPDYREEPQAARGALAEHIKSGYAGAREYLITEQKMLRDQVDAYPRTQVVFLAMVRHYDHWRDEFFKWTYLPLWQTRQKVDSDQLEQALKASSDRYGWCTQPTAALVPGILFARVAEARCEQNIALIQTVECLRMHAATHDGTLPGSLGELSVPAPIEPFTGQPIQYRLDGANAIITGHPLPGLQNRIVVRVAQ